ncbi:MAG: hypothetical protein AAGE59_33815, partial [Cyanobacteria bacterium P01_F01_bin.86]
PGIPEHRGDKKFSEAPILCLVQKILVNPMSDQNSEVLTQIRPEQVMEQLGIRKDAYYADLKFLGIQAQRDSDGKSYLDEGQFQLLVALRQHVEAIGPCEGS